MPKTPKTGISKARAYSAEFPKEFKVTPRNDLYCNLCQVIVCHERRSTVSKHRESAKHNSMLNKKETLSTQQSFLNISENHSQTELADKIVEAFLSANIPLYKVRNLKIRDLFTYLGRVVPSESTLRSRVAGHANAEVLRIKQEIHEKKVFLVTDESDINGKKYFNTLIGTLDNPEKTYIVDCRVCEVSVDQHYVVRLVDDVLKSLNVEREDFALLLSDAARYMTAAGNTLKILYPLLLHVTCVAHLFHNCAEKVRGFYTNVDILIARVKAATVKNKCRKSAFQTIGQPPEPIITRWATWLRAALYYADHLPTVKRIVNGFSGDGILVRRAKDAVRDPELPKSLMNIKSSYECLIHLVEKSESKTYNMETAYQDIKSIDFKEDPCNINGYIKKRLEKNNDLTVISTLSRDDLAPSQYFLLQQCQATSVSVERSFSILKKLLAKDRIFNENNIPFYLIMYYNTVVQE
jgi:hypothetical protein